MIIPKLSGNINLCNFKRLPKFERCGLSLLTATPTVPRLMPHPICLLRLYKMGRGVSFFLHTPNWDKILISILKLNYNKEWGEENSLT